MGWNQSLGHDFTVLHFRPYIPFRFDRLADPHQDRKYDILEADGIAGVGERIAPSQVYINKQTPTNLTTLVSNVDISANTYKNAPLFYKSPEPGYVDKVITYIYM